MRRTLPMEPSEGGGEGADTAYKSDAGEGKLSPLGGVPVGGLPLWFPVSQFAESGGIGAEEDEGRLTPSPLSC